MNTINIHLTAQSKLVKRVSQMWDRPVHCCMPWRPGPGKVGQGGLKVFHLWRHSQKTCIPRAKKFFSSAD